MKTLWTTREIVEMAMLAIDNASDNDSTSFKPEWAFQVNAPEHRGRAAPTKCQVDAARAIWIAWVKEGR